MFLSWKVCCEVGFYCRRWILMDRGIYNILANILYTQHRLSCNTSYSFCWIIHRSLGALLIIVASVLWELRLLVLEVAVVWASRAGSNWRFLQPGEGPFPLRWNGFDLSVFLSRDFLGHLLWICLVIVKTGFTWLSLLLVLHYGFWAMGSLGLVAWLDSFHCLHQFPSNWLGMPWSPFSSLRRPLQLLPFWHTMTLHYQSSSSPMPPTSPFLESLISRTRQETYTH